jgi:poly-gamma-glutamate synthesis protein (capsule biosynthesis protein)
MASTFRDYSDALPPRGAAPGRPGVNPVHLTRITRVTPEMMRALRGVRDALEAPGDSCERTERARERRVASRADADVPLELGDATYRIGTPVGDHWEMRALDRDEILDSIRLGKRRSDLLLASIHVHELGPGCETPPDFLPELAHAAIDAGAGAFLATGEHRLMPIEIYKGRPVFYGLANFFWDDLQGALPADMYEANRERIEAAFPDRARVDDAELTALMNAEGFDDPRVFETIVAVIRWDRGRAAEIRIVPVDLGYGEPLTRSGVPRRAGPEKSRDILSRLQRISKPFGTEIAIEDGVGIIRPR